MTNVTKDNLFKPSRTRMETRAEITDKAAKGIIDEAAAKRIAKTEKLRQARLTKEAEDAENALRSTAPVKRTGKSK
ncbi:MAG: hypothetical protein ACRECW_05165 [Phyllobacterium sp.]